VRVKTLQEPRVTLRISADLYNQLVAIAEARDCTLQQALDFYLERVKQEGKREAQQLILKSTPEPKPKEKIKTIEKIVERPVKLSKKAFRDKSGWVNNNDLGILYRTLKELGIELTD
jgi:hypothetical protein